MTRRARYLSLACVLGGLGCSSAPAAPDASDDAAADVLATDANTTSDATGDGGVLAGSLLGTWEATYTGGMDFESVRLHYELSGTETGGSMHEEIEGFSRAPATSCRYLGIADGGWAGGPNSLQISPVSGTEQRDSCADPSQNVAVQPTTASYFLSNYGSLRWLSPDSFVMNGATYHRL